MKKILLLIFISLVALTSCSSGEEINDLSIHGSWKLSSYIIERPFDINKDGVENLNLLNEIDCVANETLIFDKDGTFISDDSFHHEINISKHEEGVYVFDIECSDGYISTSSTYKVNSNGIITINNVEFAHSINGNKMTRNFPDFIEVYNEDFTEVIEYKDLTLVYVK
jgi:purine-nucleoside phosphorylase